MKAICVDDEPLVLNLAVSLCRELPELETVEGFTNAREALAYLETESADLALLDIDMPDINGLMLAAKLKELCPQLSVIFLTGYAQYAVDAFELHASGYLLKPIHREKLAAEVSYALSRHPSKKAPRVTVQTFGTFELLIDSKAISFGRSKAKELLAYLIDRQGDRISRAEAFAALWENGQYDRSMQKQLDVIIRSLRDTLQEYGLSDLFEIKGGVMRIVPSRIDCDLYRFLNGDIDAVNAYRGEYMSSYPWANITEAYMTRQKNEAADR
ncbi:MAG: response regulator [Clostridia bacterium]|nr:response regulator [Clostridia bacterium]